MSNIRQPLVTFALLSYNQEQFIRDAIEGAFEQDYSPLEIIISDDHSTDETFEIIQDLSAKYSGLHKIIINQNNKNIGLISHINKIFEMANGELIVAAAGDDISLSNRVSQLVAVYNKSQPMLIHSAVEIIDKYGKNCGKWEPPIISKKMSIFDITKALSIYIGASGAWNINLYKKYGPIKYTNSYEDLALGFRAALENSTQYIDIPLVKYRRGIGLSNDIYDIHLSLHDLLNIRKSRIEKNIANYSQRILDLNKIKTHTHFFELKKILIERVYIEKTSYEIYNKPASLANKIFSKNCLTALLSIALELMRIIKIIANILTSRIIHSLKNIRRKSK